MYLRFCWTTQNFTVAIKVLDAGVWKNVHTKIHCFVAFDWETAQLVDVPLGGGGNKIGVSYVCMNGKL